MKSKNIKICIVVVAEDLKNFFRNIAKNAKVSRLIELRVDYICDLSILDIEVISRETKKYPRHKFIFTCRHKKDDGEFQGSEKKLIKITETAVKYNFDYLDIDLRIISKINLENKNKKTKIICSTHDFSKTPAYRELEKIKKKIKKTKTDIIKIATIVKKENDLNNLFKLLINKESKEEMIVLGMGKEGKRSRILAPLLGGYLTFASIGAQKSAPGQIDIKRLEKIYDDLCE